MTSKVAASRPTTSNLGIDIDISVGQLFRTYTATEGWVFEGDADRAGLRRAVARARALARRIADALGADGARPLRAIAFGRAADHRAGVELHDGEPHARRPRRLRLSQPRRPLLRQPRRRRRLGDP